MGILLSGALSAGTAEAAKKEVQQLPRPTHADAAVILAKYSGFFDRYVAEDATLNDCVSFLNQTGIYFGLMEIVNGAEYTLEDCARTMGQMSLVFSGEAHYLAGKVMLPKGIDSWEELCILNDVKYDEAYKSLINTLIVLHNISQ